MPAELAVAADPVPGFQMAAAFVYVLISWDRDGGSSDHSSFSCKDANTIMVALNLVTSSKTSYLPKAPHLNTITLKVRD